MWFWRMFRSRVEYFKVLYSPSSLSNTLLRLNWMLDFLKQPWSNARSTIWVIWGNNLETFEKLFSIIQSRCNIYSHFLKSLHRNIHELCHQALTVMKITVDFEKIPASLHFLHLTSINWLVLKIRLCFHTWCRVLCA